VEVGHRLHEVLEDGPLLVRVVHPVEIAPPGDPLEERRREPGVPTEDGGDGHVGRSERLDDPGLLLERPRVARRRLALEA
jgi:hypothetical protein